MTIAVDLAGILGDAWRAPNMGRVSPPLSTRGSRERREISQQGPGQSRGQKRIVAYFEGHRTLFCICVTKSEGDNLH